MPVTFDDKDNTLPTSNPRRLVRAVDMNELKSEHNTLEGEYDATAAALAAHAALTNNPHSVTKAQVGLSDANNTADTAKPVSTAQQTALNAKQPTLVSGTNIKTINGSSVLGAGNLDLAALGAEGTIITGLDASAGAGGANLTVINAALAAAASGERLIIPVGLWHVNGPIDITSYTKHIRLEVVGDLEFSSGGNGLVVGNTTATPYRLQEVNVYGTLYGDNAGTTYGSFAAGAGLLIKNATNGRYFLNSAEGWAVAIQLEASGGSATGSLHNHIRFGILDRNALCLQLICTGHNSNFVNQNYFYGGNMAGGAGCKFTKNGSQVDPFNGNMFYGCATENIVTGICWDIDFAENNVFTNGRTIGPENPTTADRFKFSSTASFNKVIGYVMMSGDIDDLGKFNDFSNSRIIDAGTGEETALYYDHNNKRLGVGRTDDQHYPYFMPQANVDVRGNVQIRKDADYGYTGEDTYLYLGSSHVVSDGGVEKGYAFRVEYTGAETPSVLKLYAYTGFVGTSERFTVPSDNLTEIFSISAGKLTMAASPSVVGEIPAGTINGTNDTFTIANSNPTQVALYSDGIRADPANFSISGTTLEITNALIIPTNSLLIDYTK